MTPQEFKTIWTSTGDILSPFTSARLLGLNLKPKTIEFLTEAGLPDGAPPFLSFADNSQDMYKGIAPLTGQYDFLEEEFKRWIVIGSCSDGDPIAINVEANDQVDWLDHENYFEPGFFNSSIDALAHCLVIYRNFVSDVLRDNGEDAFLNGDISDIQFEKLKNELLKADNKALADNGFWKEQLTIDIAIRDDYKKG